ncbi:hypothetical protein ACFSVM_25715, partial [Paenibacillus shunpengii]
RSTIQNSDALKAGKAGDLEGFMKGMDKLLDQQNISEEAFERMLDSPAAKWNKVLNTFKFNLQSTGIEALSAFEPLFDAINTGFDSGQFTQVFGSIQSGLSILANVATAVFQFLLNNFEVVKNALLVIAVVSAAVATNFMIGWIVANWPLVLVVAGLIGIITVLNNLGFSTSEVIGFIIGLFYSLAATVNNVIAVIWNTILSFVEFFANVFVDPIYAVQSLFYNMFHTVADYFTNLINTILDGLNWVINKINEIAGTSINLIAEVEKAQGPTKPTTDKSVLDLSKYRMEQMNALDSFKAGNAKADNLVKSINGFTAGVAPVPAGGYSVPSMPSMPKTPDIGKVDKVGEVGKINDEVDISSEDLKALRELAEIKSIQNFVSLTPTVQVTTGDIMQTMDVDTMIDQITDALEKEIASSAKGVYE